MDQKKIKLITILTVLLLISLTIVSLFGTFIPTTYARDSVSMAAQGMGQDMVDLFIVVPLLFPLKLPFKVSKPVQEMYDKIESLPAGSYVFVSADYDPASMPELQPFLDAFLEHAFKKDLKIVLASLWPNAPSLVINALDEVGVKKFGKEQNVDFCYLGYKAGAQLVILDLGESVYKAFIETPIPPQKNTGENISKFTIMLSEVLQKYISRYPEQWYRFEQVWT